MSRNSSSTSSSEPESATEKASVADHLREVWIISCTLFATLALIDVSINALFPGPRGVVQGSAGTLGQYFDYGRSIEGKIRRMIGPTDATTSPLAVVGWVEPKDSTEKAPSHFAETDVGVAVYGMSFSNDAARALEKLDSTVKLRLISGPASPASHSFASFLADGDRHNAKVVVLGVLATSVKGLAATSAMNWQFESPAPYTYPRYSLVDGELKPTWPPARSLDEFRACLADPDRWKTFVAQMRQEDEFYSPLFFDESWVDALSLMRLVRRAWATRHVRNVEQTIHTSAGFVSDSSAVTSLKSIVKAFASTAHKQHRLPVVLLFNNVGYGDHLDRALRSTVLDANIPFVSTSDICPSSDLKNFVPDGHFTHEANEKIGQALRKILKDSGLLSDAAE